MLYTSDAPPVRSIDVEGTPTVNARRYRRPNAQVLLSPQGRPIALRRVRVLKPGTFAGASRLQLITPRKTRSVGRKVFDAWRARCHPLN
jgi:hypothetical protein